MILAEEIAAARREQGLSQQEVADQLGIPRLAVTRLEAGQASSDVVVRAMKALHVRLSNVGKGSTLPEQLAARRHRLGWTIDKVAERAGIDRRTVEAVEAGRGSLTSMASVLSVIAPDWTRHKPLRATWSYDRGDADRDKRFTPPGFLRDLEAVFGRISLDPCGHPEAVVTADRIICLPDDGLTADWSGSEFIFINPPFSATAKWLQRCVDSWVRGDARVIVALTPARTNLAAFQSGVARHADVLFLKELLKFGQSGGGEFDYRAPIALMLSVFGASEEEIEALQERMPSVRLRPNQHGQPKGSVPR